MKIETRIRPAVSIKPFGFWSRLTAAAALRRQRRELTELDAHLLADIGVSPAQATKEATRSLWDAPENWYARK